jgi:serine/threonine-protein kinase
MLPFTGETMGEIMVKHVTQLPPAPRGAHPHLPPTVEQIILRCLGKDPAARFQSMNELREALLDPDRYLASSPPVMPSAPQSSPSVMSIGEPPTPLAPMQERPPAPAQTLQTGAAPRASVPAAPSDGRTHLMERDPALVAAMAGAPPPLPGDSVQAVPGAPNLPPAEPGATASQMPGMPFPAAAKNATMVIGTPHGYSNKPPRKLWPAVVAVVAFVAVVGASTVAMLWTPADGAHSGDAPAASEVAVPNGEPERDDQERAAPRPEPPTSAHAVMPSNTLAKIQISTVPEGATVSTKAGDKLGVTPLTLHLPRDGVARDLVFTHPRARERSKTIAITGDMAVSVELEPLSASPGEAAKREATAPKQPSKKRRPKIIEQTKPPARAGDGVIAPDFD